MDNSGSHTISFFRSQRFIFLSLFMALALVPIILQSITTYWQATINLTQTTDENMSRLGQVQHQRIHEWVANLETQVLLPAKDDEILTMDPAQATAIIQKFMETVLDLEAVILADSRCESVLMEARWVQELSNEFMSTG